MLPCPFEPVFLILLWKRTIPKRLRGTPISAEDRVDVLGINIREIWKHRGFFWEKDWETINEGSYCGIIVPIVQEVILSLSVISRRGYWARNCHIALLYVTSVAYGFRG